MTEQTATRRLTAVLCADVVGYSRLMSQDDADTLRTLTAYREVFFDQVQARQGRIVNAPGDSILAEFPSVLDAVDAAVAIQRELTQRNATLPKNRRMAFRIGVTLGDVLVKDNEIYGDGVNIAARLQALAEPGGIYLTGMVYESVQVREAFHYESLGEKRLKNIPVPIRVYRVDLDGPHGYLPARARLLVRALRHDWRRAIGSAALLAMVAAAAGFGWHLVSRSNESREALMQIASIESGVRRSEASESAVPARAVRPTVAVLPFVGLDESGGTDALATGLTETLIADLARLTNLRVIAHGSTERYRGAALDARRLADELGATHVLRTSIQRHGDRVRISARVLETDTALQVWAERYDGQVSDVFEFQDRIARAIVTALDVELVGGEMSLTRRRQTENLEALETLQRAEARWYRDETGQSCDSYQHVAQLYDRAVKLDPEYAAAWVGKAWHALRNLYFGCGGSPEVSLHEATEYATRALGLAPQDPEAHTVLAIALLYQREYEGFQRVANRAVELGPGHAETLANVAWGKLYVGRYREAEELIRRAMDVHPYFPAWYLNVLAIARFWQGDLRVAQETLARSLDRNNQQVFAMVYAVAVREAMGQKEASAERAKALLEAHPDFTIEGWLRDSEPYRPAQASRITALLLGAGLPRG